MTVLYSLAKGQLSRQYHYDFGLRALKAVLVMAGELKRGSPDLQEVNNNESYSLFAHTYMFVHTYMCEYISNVWCANLATYI